MWHNIADVNLVNLEEFIWKLLVYSPRLQSPSLTSKRKHVRSGVAPGLHLSIFSRFMRLYSLTLSPKVWGRVLLKETDSICHHSRHMYQNNIYSLFAPFTRFASSIFTKQNPCWRIIFVVHIQHTSQMQNCKETEWDITFYIKRKEKLKAPIWPVMHGEMILKGENRYI